jgi:hypothetical protein
VNAPLHTRRRDIGQGHASVPPAQTSLRVALAMFAVYVLLARIEPDLRYTRYLLPAALAGLWLARRAYGEPLPLFRAPLIGFGVVIVALLVWSGVGIVLSSSFYARYFEEALFLLAPLGAAMVCASLKRHDGSGPLIAVFGVLAADYILEIGLQPFHEAVIHPALFVSDLMQSVAPTESVRAFSFGVLAVAFLARRQGGMAAFALVLAVIAGKRIVLAGLLVAVPVALLAPALESTKRRAAITLLAVAINVFMVLSIRNLEEWGIADQIQDATLQSADAVLMGRARLFALLADRLPDSPVVGVGLGRITHILIEERAWLTNTHSDLLKHFIEVGPLMFSLWIGCFYWFSRHRGPLALAIFMNVLFLSDNVSIYFDVMFPFYLALAYLHDARPAMKVRKVLRPMRPTCARPFPQAA